MGFVFIWEQTATCATYSINWWVFITEMKSVYCAVRIGSLNKAVCASSLKSFLVCANTHTHIYMYIWRCMHRASSYNMYICCLSSVFCLQWNTVSVVYMYADRTQTIHHTMYRMLYCSDLAVKFWSRITHVCVCVCVCVCGVQMSVTVAINCCESPIWNCLHFTLLAPRILRSSKHICNLEVYINTKGLI